MFEILGRVIHHVEDMAQPQHTRNDLHIPPGYPFGSAIRAAYELTTEHTYGYGTEDVDANVIQQNLDGLEIARARELWMTTDEGVGPAAGRGISQYSNGNFVTQGTNFQGVDRIYAASGGILLIDAGTDPNYVLPSGSAATLTAVTYGQEINDVPEDVEIPISQPPPDAVINWVGTDDLDALLGQTSRNLFTSKLALNAGDLAGLAVSAELPGGFTLGNGNFVEARRRLLPKAVAYSAALLNYFFRGTILSDGTPALRFSLGSFGFGNNVLGGGPASMTLRNASNEDLHGGKLQVFYDTAGGTRALLGEKGIDIRAGKTVTIGSADTGFFRDGATWETLWGPQRAAQGSIVLVYVGSMGAEASPPGDAGSEYAVASRVCTCPPQFDGSGPSGPDDPQLECEQFCCEYLLNASGYPGVPGDGKTVPLFSSDYSSFAGTYGGFDLFPRLRGDLLPNGLTITVFPALPPTQIVGYGATDYMRAGLCSLPNLTNGCVTSFGSGFVQNIVTVDGVTGYPESILPWSFTDTCPFELCSPNICYCGDGNAIPGTQIIELDPCFSSTSCEEGCFCDLSNHLAIDAIAICRDADMYPE